MSRRAISPNQKAEIKALIVKTLKSGCDKKRACKYAGIDETTFYDWVRQDTQFAQSVEHSYAEVAIYHAGNITKAGAKDWKASLAWLKANCNDVWGDKTTISGDKENPLQVETKIEHKLDAGTIKTALDILRDAGMLEPPTNEPEV